VASSRPARLNGVVPPFEPSAGTVAAGEPSAGTSPVRGTATSKRPNPRRGKIVGLRLEEATMEMLKRVPQRAEKPGRLQLAIIEWQRQLIEKREARTVDEKRPEAA